MRRDTKFVGRDNIELRSVHRKCSFRCHRMHVVSSRNKSTRREAYAILRDHCRLMGLPSTWIGLVDGLTGLKWSFHPSASSNTALAGDRGR